MRYSVDTFEEICILWKMQACLNESNDNNLSLKQQRFKNLCYSHIIFLYDSSGREKRKKEIARFTVLWAY